MALKLSKLSLRSCLGPRHAERASETPARHRDARVPPPDKPCAQFTDLFDGRLRNGPTMAEDRRSIGGCDIRQERQMRVYVPEDLQDHVKEQLRNDHIWNGLLRPVLRFRAGGEVVNRVKDAEL